MPRCCAYNCSNSKKLFRLPRDKNRQKIWLQKINRADLPSVIPTEQDLRLCSLHFDPDQYEKVAMKPDGTKKLRPFAVPTLFSHKPTKRKEKPPTNRGTYDNRNVALVPVAHELNHSYIKPPPTSKPAVWYQETHPDWAPSLHLGYDLAKTDTAHERLQENDTNTGPTTFLPLSETVAGPLDDALCEREDSVEIKIEPILLQPERVAGPPHQYLNQRIEATEMKSELDYPPTGNDTESPPLTQTGSQLLTAAEIKTEPGITQSEAEDGPPIPPDEIKTETSDFEFCSCGVSS